MKIAVSRKTDSTYRSPAESPRRGGDEAGLAVDFRESQASIEFAEFVELKVSRAQLP